ncbi:MAG TPA: DoxX family protein [Terracidiphilus sp.]|nr:DoxX family protein [Terracidiphilus sp.]
MRNRLPLMLVRVIVGVVFLTEGILKFMRPEQLGAGRFTQIGLPFAHFLGPFVAGVEVTAGAAMILGLFAGDAAVLLLCVIGMALLTTKLPILLGHGFWHFHAPEKGPYGILQFIHEARTDLAMLFGLVAVLIDRGVQIGRKRKWYQPK